MKRSRSCSRLSSAASVFGDRITLPRRGPPVALDPGRIAAISRRLSRAIPPVERSQIASHPERMPAKRCLRWLIPALASLWDAGVIQRKRKFTGQSLLRMLLVALLKKPDAKYADWAITAALHWRQFQHSSPRRNADRVPRLRWHGRGTERTPLVPSDRRACPGRNGPSTSSEGSR